MRTLLFACLLAVAGLVYGCEPAQKEPHSAIVVPPLAAKVPPPAPTPGAEPSVEAPDYQHRIEKSPIIESKIGEGRTLKWRLAVARFGDMRRAIRSPFTPGSEVTIAGRTIIVKSADVEPCPAFTEMLIQKLIDCNRFIVVERKDINKILLEQQFELGGRVQRGTAAAVRKVLGVELIITGEVATVKVKTADGTAINDQTSVMLRIYDVSTAEILGSATVTCDNLQDAVDQATAKVVASIKDRVWMTKISRCTGAKVFLNAGDVDGVHPGDQFRVFSVGAEIRDPDEGTVLGRDSAEAGRIEVTAVFEKYCEARIMKAAVPFRVGDLAEFVPGPYAQVEMGRPGGGL